MKKRRVSVKVLARREKVKAIVIRGYHSQREIAKALKVNKSTIMRDMRAVRKELQDEIRAERIDANAVLMDFLTQLRGIYKEAWTTYTTAVNDNAKVGALRLMHDMMFNKIKIAQSLGIVREVAPLRPEPTVIRFEEPGWLNEDSPEKLPAVAAAGKVPQKQG